MQMLALPELVRGYVKSEELYVKVEVITALG